MRKEVLTYTDFNGDEHKDEEFYFNLNKMELAEYQFSWDGGIQEVLRKIQKSREQKLTIEMMKKLMEISYGERVGNSFQKLDENGKRLVYKNFFGTGADDVLFTKMMTGDGHEISDFIRDILPKDLREQAEKTIEDQKNGTAKVLPGPGSEAKPENK